MSLRTTVFPRFDEKQLETPVSNAHGRFFRDSAQGWGEKISTENGKSLENALFFMVIFGTMTLIMQIDFCERERTDERWGMQDVRVCRNMRHSGMRVHR